MGHYEALEHQSEFSQELSKLEDVFAKELTPELAHDYVSSLVEALGGIGQPFAEFVAKGKELHYGIGKDIYGPLIVGFCQWLEKYTEALNYKGKIFFALRDAVPLVVAAEELWKGNGLIPEGIYANRPMLGVEDEIAPEKSNQNGSVLTYLKNKGLLASEKVIWADSGAWGTVIKALKTGLLSEKEFYPFFWYSHNPYIPGYLNGLLAKAGLEDKFGEILNDSMECVFPQKWLRPLFVTPDSKDVILLPSDYLSVIWGKAALEGVKAAAGGFKDGITEDKQIKELHKLHVLSEKAKSFDLWTGVLPTNTPTWSQGAEFLAGFSARFIGKEDKYE